MSSSACGSKTDTKTAIILVAFLLLSVLFNISLIALILAHAQVADVRIQYPSVSNRFAGTIEEGSLCLTPDVGESRAAAPAAEVILIDGRQMICFKKHDDSLLHLIKLFLVQYDLQAGVIRAGRVYNATQESTSPQIDTRPSAHLYFDQKKFKGDAIVWSRTYGFNTAYVTGSIKFLNNSLFIVEDGFYFIYTSLTLLTRDDHPDSQIRHSLAIHNTNQTRAVLSKPVSLRNRRGYFTSSCLVETLKLQHGDVLTVHLSNHSYLYNSSSTNYFGIYRI